MQKFYKMENGKWKIESEVTMENVIETKSFNFSIRIVNLYNHLKNEKQEFVMSKQMLRCGTSIGANVAEAEQAQSKADFISKMNIVLKETAETKYWLKLLKATDYLTDKEFDLILNDCIEIEKMLSAIIKSSKA